MKIDFQYLKLNKIIKILFIVIIFSTIIAVFSILWSPEPNSKSVIECKKNYEDNLKCDFSCNFQVNIINATTRAVVYHNLWCAIYDKTFYGNSITFSLPKRNFYYQLMAFTNKDNYFRIYGGTLKC